ncbi:uncharacterized protein LOC110684505 [Chenopodium quinoa]|uniref:uncharacterized protein LOC110684505 n=1 Tax=Chenopodium quinoa TaxID=63459 RepID=UPI000B7727BC|nr:uncharacterized protein LOC110684505 [Chenopodium quinoa]
MVKEIVQNDRVRSAFDRISTVSVSETPNLKVIQEKIAKDIGCDEKLIIDKDKVDQRAMILNMHLHSEQEKTLIILDNVRGKVDVKTIGVIPGNEYCKILVVSRTDDVCRLMGVDRDENILEMKRLSKNEARCLFWKKVYEKEKEVDNITSSEYLSLADRMLDYCQGSPQAVGSLAKVLRDEDLSKWKEFAEKLDKKSSSDDVIRTTWDESLKISDSNSEEKKRFYLIACAFPPETSIPVREVMRIGIGLDLFNSVKNLSEAISLAHTWANEMSASSWLEAQEDDQGVSLRLTDDARTHTLSLLQKDKKEMFMLEDIPRWRYREGTYQQMCTTISLAAGSDHSRLNGLKFEKLEVLIQDNTEPHNEFTDDFFKGMSNLKVLALKQMGSESSKLQLPESTGKLLSKLKALHLENCELGDLRWIGDLIGLVVLSFRNSKMEELPADGMKNIHHLRLLDLSNCKIQHKVGIPANLLKSLSDLEGLYAYNSFEDWAEESDEENESARIDELNFINFLNVVEIKVRNLEQFPVNSKFITNLDHFYVSVGLNSPEESSQSSVNLVSKSPSANSRRLSRTLRVGSIEKIDDKNNMKMAELLKKTEQLRLEKMAGWQHFVKDFDKKTTKMEISLPGNRSHDPEFPCLQILEIFDCDDMLSFSEIPLKAPNLTHLRVKGCNKLIFLFVKCVSQGDFTEFPRLTDIVLEDLETLATMSREMTEIDSYDSKLFSTLFHGKMTFISLEKLSLRNCNQIVKLWDIEQEMNTYDKLQYICIYKCNKLQSLGSFATSNALKQIKTIEIDSCSKIKEVISWEGDDRLEISIFPTLEKLFLSHCPSIQRFFSGKQKQVVHLKALKILHIKYCPRMQSFTSGDVRAPLSEVKFEPYHLKRQQTEDINNFLLTHSLQQNPSTSGDESGNQGGGSPGSSARNAKRNIFKSICFCRKSSELNKTSKRTGSNIEGNKLKAQMSEIKTETHQE